MQRALDRLAARELARLLSGALRHGRSVAIRSATMALTLRIGVVDVIEIRRHHLDAGDLLRCGSRPPARLRPSSTISDGTEVFVLFDAGSKTACCRFRTFFKLPKSGRPDFGPACSSCLKGGRTPRAFYTGLATWPPAPRRRARWRPAARYLRATGARHREDATQGEARHALDAGPLIDPASAEMLSTAPRRWRAAASTASASIPLSPPARAAPQCR